MNNDEFEMLVSIIIPIYKVEKYIHRCIESVRQQTYQNIEIILVDDGSPDGCPSICDDYTKKDKRIKIVHKKWGGLSDARNTGLDIAQGEYIVFVDGDDIVSENMVSEMISTLKESEADLVAVGYRRFSSEDELQAGNESFEKKLEIYSRFEGIKQLFVKNSFGNYQWNKLFKREFFETLRFPVGHTMEDLAIAYLILEQCNSIAYNTNPLYYYRQRCDSLLHTSGSGLYKDKFYFSKERYIYLKNKYGDFIENAFFMMKTIYQCFQYLDSKDDRQWARTELKYIMHCDVISFSNVERVKYQIFSRVQPLYILHKRLQKRRKSRRK